MLAIRVAERRFHMGANNSPQTISHNGKTMTVKEWSREVGLSSGLIHRRLAKGWPPEWVLSREPWPSKQTDDVRKEKKKAVSERWYAANQDYNRNYRAAHKDRIDAVNRKWKQENKDAIRSKARERDRKRRESDPHYRAAKSLRLRMRLALKNRQRRGSIITLIGCSIGHLIAHLSSMFEEGMSWGNYGTYWDIDHTMPMAAVNLDDSVELRAVANWRNLKPMEKNHNRYIKRDSVSEEAIELFNTIKKELIHEDQVEV
jgi:hypothetical protein